MLSLPLLLTPAARDAADSCRRSLASLTASAGLAGQAQGSLVGKLHPALAPSPLAPPPLSLLSPRRPMAPPPDDDDEILCDCGWTKYADQNCLSTRLLPGFPCWEHCCAEEHGPRGVEPAEG